MKQQNQLRAAVIQALEAIENLMIITGDKRTAQDKAIWCACYPLWMLLQREVRKMPHETTHLHHL